MVAATRPADILRVAREGIRLQQARLWKTMAVLSSAPLVKPSDRNLIGVMTRVVVCSKNNIKSMAVRLAKAENVPGPAG